jgi:hypothetical protein
MNDINLLLIAASYAVCFFIGAIFGVRILQKRVETMLKKEIPENVIQLSENVKRVSMPACIMRVEHVDGLMLFYNCEDDKFVCQGTTLDESAKNFCIITKNEFVGMTVVDGKKFVFHDFECLPVKE